MTPQDNKTLSKSETSVFEELEQFIPKETLPTYHRYLAYVRKLPQDDEILHLLQAMGFLTMITRQVPVELIAEHKELRKYVFEVQQNIGHSVMLTQKELVSAENAIKASNQELNKIAALITESARTVRKGFIEAGEQVDAQRISQTVAERLEQRLVIPAQKAVEDMASVLSKLPKVVDEAKHSIYFLRELNEKWHWKNTVTTVFIFTLTFTSIITAMMYGSYRDKIAVAIEEVNGRASVNEAVCSRLNAVHRTLYLDTSSDKWKLYMEDSNDTWLTDKKIGVIEFRP